MPIYEYRCNDCGELFEKIARMSEADLIPFCPACGNRNVEKDFSTIAVIGNQTYPGGNASASSCAPRGGFG
jgi:putative FmdB family regulatory protein